jgi:hypothetical protein
MSWERRCCIFRSIVGSHGARNVARVFTCVKWSMTHRKILRRKDCLERTSFKWQ